MSLQDNSVILFLICILQFLINISAQGTPSFEPTYEPHPTMLPTPGNYEDFNPTSFPTNSYHWNEGTTIAISIGSIIGGSSVIAAGYFAYSRGLFAPDSTVKAGSFTQTPNTTAETSPLHAPGEAKKGEMMPLLDDAKV